MNWLNNIFKKSATTVAGNEHSNSIVEDLLSNQEQDISKNLFVDENPPAPDTEDITSPNKLKEFLDDNYYLKGYTDGYEFHSSDILENAKKKIKAEFRYIIDLTIDEKNSESFRLTNQIINIQGISDRLPKQLENRISHLKTTINNLESEKRFSAEDEGLVMVPIHNYHDGFVKGTEQFLIEKEFALSTGMYN